MAFGGKADDDLQGLLQLAPRAWMFLICMHTVLMHMRRIRAGGCGGEAVDCQGLLDLAHLTFSNFDV